ncbi:MAG: hypothetical protein Q3965_05785 [Rothia sp. (in: high G+C Gram-positive bacteria)]|nr:hypothetical protein [Rothia sp. (in: high G+C Gram-positive bacteria)]
MVTKTLRLAFLLLLLGIAWALLIFAPHTGFSAWASTRLLVAQGLAFPRLAAPGVLLGCLLVLFAAWVVRRRGRRVLAAALTLVLVWGAPAALLLASPYALMQHRAVPALACAASKPFTVTSWNAQGHVDNKSWSALLATDPDVLVMPEAETENVAGLPGAEHYQIFSAQAQLQVTPISPPPRHSAGA